MGMKTAKGKIHQYAVCQTCGWENANYVNDAAKKAARQHALKTGHTVTVETGTFITFNAR